MSGIPQVDSASVARFAWARAGQAMRKRDLAAARMEVERAAAAWPTQQVYAWARVTLAVRAADAAGFGRALRAYTTLGFGGDLKSDTALARMASLSSLRPVVARNDANRRARPHGTVQATLPDSTFWPEGVDYDPRTLRFYVTSVRHGTIAEVNGDGRVREVVPRHSQHIGAILGVRVDPTRDVLWATTSGIPQLDGYQPADSGIAALLRVRISDGAIEARWDLPPVTGGHVLGDLAVGPTGDVYVTDSTQPVLYRLRAGADTLERFTNPLFHSLQGVAPTGDGRALYVADYSHGLLRVDLATGTVSRLADAPGSTSLGCDGIAVSGNTIIAVQNGVVPAQIMRYDVDPLGMRIVHATVLDRELEMAPEPTIGALAGDTFVYVANSLWEEFDDDGIVKQGAMLTRPRLIAVRWVLSASANRLFESLTTEADRRRRISLITGW
jgi:sugar lactone lactonase YvrE